MIEWKKYDKENPPLLQTLFIVKHEGGITSAKLKSSSERLNWQSYNGNYLFGITHYTEINLPIEEMEGK
jgi:hypothetical protein